MGDSQNKKLKVLKKKKKKKKKKGGGKYSVPVAPLYRRR